MEGIASPESTKQRALIDAGKDGVTSDIILTVTNSHKNPNLRFKFTIAFLQISDRLILILMCKMLPMQLVVLQCDMIQCRWNNYRINY